MHSQMKTLEFAFLHICFPAQLLSIHHINRCTNSGWNWSTTGTLRFERSRSKAFHRSMLAGQKFLDPAGNAHCIQDEDAKFLCVGQCENRVCRDGNSYPMEGVVAASDINLFHFHAVLIFCRAIVADLFRHYPFAESL